MVDFDKHGHINPYDNVRNASLNTNCGGRWRSEHDLTVILQQSVNCFFPGKFFDDSPPTFYPHLPKKYIIVDHTSYSLGELLWASWLNYDPCPPVLHNLGNPACPRRQDRGSRCHCFNQRHAKGFVNRRKNEQISFAVPTRKVLVWYEADKANTIGHLTLQHRSQRAAISRIAQPAEPSRVPIL